MRTIDRLSSIAAVSWLRDGAGRMRRAMMVRHPAVRLALILAPMLIMAAVGYWIAGTLTPSGPRYLAQGRSFSSDDLITIFKALDAKAISYRPDDRKIAVAAEQYDQAAALLAKLDVGPRPFSEIREGSESLNDLLLTSEDRRQRDRLRSEKMIERLINTLQGVVWSVVSIQHPRATFVHSSRIKPKAFVYVECDPSRSLPLQTIQAIPAILTGMGNEPELSADAITVMDRSGRLLLDPHNPTLGRETRARVREQELRDQIGDLLSWIKGVRILLVPGDHGRSAQATPGQVERANADGNAGAPDRPSPAIAVNRPADLGEFAPASADGGAVEEVGRGRVYVYVPRSYYYLAMPRPDHREPTLEELQQVAAKTRERVERMLRPPVIPESWTVEVNTMPDDVPMTRTAALPAAADHRRIATDWGIIGAVAATVALLLAMGSWIQAARWPLRSIDPSPAAHGIARTRPTSRSPRSGSASWSAATPRSRPASSSAWATQGGRVS